MVSKQHMCSRYNWYIVKHYKTLQNFIQLSLVLTTARGPKILQLTYDLLY
jgi:hypothetical protein